MGSNQQSFIHLTVLGPSLRMELRQKGEVSASGAQVQRTDCSHPLLGPPLTIQYTSVDNLLRLGTQQ